MSKPKSTRKTVDPNNEDQNASIAPTKRVKKATPTTTPGVAVDATSFKATQDKFYQYLVKLSEAYYNSGDTMVTDQEFDALVEDYEKKFNQEFVYLGSAHHAKTQLPVCMPSLTKCKDESSLTRFVNASPTATQYTFSEKLDGVSLMIWYHKDNRDAKELSSIKLLTRGNGDTGSDVTHLLKWIKVPSGFNCDGIQDVYVRGELIIPKAHTDTLGAQLRQMICGVINAKNPDVNVLKQADFVAHSIVNHPSQPTASQAFKMLRTWKFNIPQVVISTSCDLAVCNTNFDLILKQTKYQCDGVVIAKNVHEVISTSDKPKNTIAFKRSGAREATTVVQVLWQESRYGMLHPRVQIVPVQLNASKVEFVAGFNAKYILDNNIGPGSAVTVEMCGDVIPNIVQVHAPSTCGKPQMPTADFTWDGVNIKVSTEGGVVSEDQAIARLVYSLKTLDAKGISESTVKKLYTAGFTDEWKLFHDMTYDQLLLIDGVKDATARNILKSIDCAKNTLRLVNLLLISACFANYGQRKMQSTIDVIDVPAYLLTRNMTDERVKELLGTQGIKTMSDVFIKGCEQFRNNPMFMKLLAVVQQKRNTSVEVIESSQATAPVASKGDVVFSGFRDQKLKDAAAATGYRVIDASVTKQTVMVVVKDPDSSSSKVSVAKAYNIPVVTREAFMKMLTL